MRCVRRCPALECLPDAARLIPASMDDASAFRAASEVQNAYRKLIGAAELVDRVVEIRRQMCNNAGNAAAIDFPQPNVFRDAEFFGGLRYGMVSNFYDLYQAGTWPASEMPMRERLLALHRAGAEFHLATGEEITAMVAADVERYRADNLPSSQRPTRRVVGF